MRLNRSLYRARQFFTALFTKPTVEDTALATKFLNSSQLNLFLSMAPSEQIHAVAVMQEIEKVYTPELPPGILLTAALLHDVGKSLYPLSIWERVLIVLARAFLPRQFQRWGEGEPTGWKRGFVVAKKHPAWGSDLAEDCGTLPQTVTLIRLHQTPIPNDLPPDLHQMLTQLRTADNKH